MSSTTTTARVRLIRTGLVPLSPGYVYRSEAGNLLEALGRGVPSSAKLWCPIGAVLVEHPARGPILIDTGMHPVVATDPRRNLGRIGAAVMNGLRIGPEENAPAQLRAWGLSPLDVELVVLTHLHPDHTSAISEFPNARFVTTRAEWDSARGPLAATRGYIAGLLPDETAVDFADFAQGEPHEGLSRTLDLLGDGSLRLVSTPGHTAGHLSVLVRTADGPVFVLADAVYTLRNLWEDILPWRTAGDEASERTMTELRAYARAHPDVPLIPTHDAGVWAQPGSRLS